MKISCKFDREQIKNAKSYNLERKDKEYWPNASLEEKL